MDHLNRLYRPKTKKKTKPRCVSVFRHANWLCEKCGSKQNLTRDHIIPKSMGGSNAVKNIQILCKSCNEEKGAAIAVYTERKRAFKYVSRFIAKNEIPGFISIYSKKDLTL